MGHIITDLKETFRRGNIFIQLIYINVSIFIIGTLINVFLQLFQHSIPDIFGIFALPASFIRFFHQPWSIITYMFMHAGLLHILFNMLWLYWFGSLAIVAATAYREPNYRVQLFLFGAIRLKYLALVVIGIDVLSITSSNAGGHIAHLGGALAGLWFAASLSKGADLTAWINWLLDAFISLFQKKTWKHKPKMKVHYGGGTTSREKDYDYNAHKKAQSDEIDRILDKLKKSGYDSLTTEEKKSLFDASKR